MIIKKKLRDVTYEEYENFLKNFCDTNEKKCRNCALLNVNCKDTENNTFWFFNKDIYNDKFLNQKIEIKVNGILNKKISF